MFLLKPAPIASSFAFEVPIEHSHRAKSQSLYSFQSLSGKVKGIAGITDEIITTKDAPVAVASLLKKLGGMFERRQRIGSIVGKENLFRLDLLEEFNVPRLEEFSLNAASEVRPSINGLYTPRQSDLYRPYEDLDSP